MQRLPVPSREWGSGLLGLLQGTLRDYHRDPFLHSLLRTRETMMGSIQFHFHARGELHQDRSRFTRCVSRSCPSSSGEVRHPPRKYLKSLTQRLSQNGFRLFLNSWEAELQGSRADTQSQEVCGAFGDPGSANRSEQAN